MTINKNITYSNAKNNFKVSLNNDDQPKICYSIQLRMAANLIKSELDKFADWILSYVPEPIKKTVKEDADKRVKRLKERIKRLHEEAEDRFTPKEQQTALKGYLKTHGIAGQRGYDPKTFIARIKPKVLELISQQKKPIKVKFIFTCGFIKEDPATAQIEEELGYFHTEKPEIVTESTDLSDLFDTMTNYLLGLVELFQKQGSGWQFDQVEYFDINIDPFEPLSGCLNSFRCKQSLEKHSECCGNHEAVGIEMPKIDKDGNLPHIKFKNYNRKMRVPFVVYADFESFTENIDTCSPDGSKSFTKQYQKHKPSGFCYLIKCFDGDISPPELVRYTAESPDEDIPQLFVESLESDIKKIYDKFRFPKKCFDGDISPPELVRYTAESPDEDIPQLFVESLESDIKKIYDKFRFPKKIVVDSFTNKEGNKIDVKRDIRFIDSFRFMSASLDSLVGNMSRECFKNLAEYYEGEELQLLLRKDSCDAVRARGADPSKWFKNILVYLQNKMASIEDYMEEEPESKGGSRGAPPEDDVEVKRESLAILASLGTTKEFLGVDMSLGDIKKLSAKDVEKYFVRYQTVLGKQVTDGLVESALQVLSQVISYVVPVDDTEALSKDLQNDELVKRELSNFAGLLVLKGGRMVALASGLFRVAKHVKLTPSSQETSNKLQEVPSTTEQTLEHN
ncbi:predicted protein [Nematostella vectensis]|uniref:Uncharacterized protein n=1 Tax=Nematostella vectensis TaxID=45351 RepID=A7SN23_NEMVE|nr:predicted protein [Nematostella vectensis]|eukprot:XP_001626975.1 predicted protein [Nematostella vectensis]